VGSWLIVGPVNTRSSRPRWQCRCTCGREREVDEYNLLYAHSTSCGCRRSASAAKHGHARRGGQRTSTYEAWQTMIRRPGRAFVWKPWSDFETFLADMGERPPSTFLVRMRQDRGFAPGNCEWSSKPGSGRAGPASRVDSHPGSSRPSPQSKRRASAIPDNVLQSAERMLRAGDSLNAVAVALGYHRNSLSRRLQENGFAVPRRGSRPVYTPDHLAPQPIVLAYKAGTSLLALSKAHGVSRSVIRRILSEAGP
jgi:lambda repressor-like predicted transcriptional regulator